jgi:hypothetical protein
VIGGGNNHFGKAEFVIGLELSVYITHRIIKLPFLAAKRT